MQKKLLTAAVAGALAAPGLALAQSSVEVYGVLYPTVGWVKYGDARTAANGGGISAPGVSKLDVQAPGSEVGFRGRESLGAGLTAWFQVASGAPLERENHNATFWASRNSAAGLQGGWGNVFVGQWTTPWSDLESLYNVGTVGVWGPSLSLMGRRETTGSPPNNPATSPAQGGVSCGNFGSAGAAVPATICDAASATGGVGHPFWKRASNMIRYTSPRMAGAQIDLMYQVPEEKRSSFGTTQATNQQMWSTSAQWAGMGGRARVGVAYDAHKDFTTVGKTDNGLALKGGFNFGVVDIGAGVEKLTYKCGLGAVAGGSATSSPVTTCNGTADGEAKVTTWALAASVPIGSGAIKAAYTHAGDFKSNAAVTNANDTGAKEFNIGYEHRFSKRTSLGVGYAKIDNKNNSVFTWSGMAPQQNGVSANGGATLLGADVTWIFVNMTHRF